MFRFSSLVYVSPMGLGLYQGRKLPRTRPKTRELELEAMAPSEPNGRYRQCKIQTRIQETF